MTMAIRCAVLALCALLVTSLPANAGGNSFADLLARAKAQDAAGHRWAPPGDNVTETVMTMLDTISTATPDQLAELSALLQRDKPPADPLAPDRQTENMPADTATFATPPLAMPPLTSSPPTPSPTAPPQDTPGLAATPAPSGATESVSPPIADQPTPTPNPTLATAEPPATPLPDQSANQPSNDGQNSSATPNSATPSPANSSQTPSGPAAPSPIADTITPSKIAPDPLTPTQAAPTPIEPAQTTDDPQRAAMLFARGLDAERRGDISGARRFYATSARQGDATAALNLGRLYDPAYLKQTTLGGVDPDPELARFWYATAARLGDTGAAPLLEALSSR